MNPLHAPKRVIIGAFLLLGVVTFASFYSNDAATLQTSDRKETMNLPRCGGGEHERLSCWADAVDAALEKHGLDVAFDVFSVLHDTEPLFAYNCHDFTHKLGQAAYFLFAKGEKFSVTPKTQYCSFGFYHGFMQTLIAKTGDPKKAREFCAYVDRQLAEKAKNAAGACYHGIGHGWASDHEEKAGGDEWKIVKPALKLCEEIAETREQHFRCYTGVFDSIAVAYYNQRYGLKIKKDDPLWLCREQTEQYKAPCYREMMTVIIRLGGNELVKAAPYVEKFVEMRHAAMSMQALADASVRPLKNKTNYAALLSVCRSLREDLRLPCISGLADGFIQYGPPEEEYKPALQFCGSPLLTSEERQSCFQAILSYTSQIYPKEKFLEICQSVSGIFPKNCDTF